MKNAASLTAVAVSTLILAGCLVPERFAAKVDIKPDGSYAYQYAGTAVNAMAAAQKKQAGSLSEKDQVALRSEADKIKKTPDVRKANYLGDGRYELDVEGGRKSGQPLDMLGIMTVRTDKDGLLTVASGELKEADKKQLAQLGIAINGTLDVSLPKNAEVVSHNATSTPTLGFGAYSWKIGKVDQRPIIKIRLK
jgi:hypothetical protein